MGILDLFKKGKKKLKTLITVPSNNFVSLTTLINSAEELELTGSDGNNVPFAQTLPATAGSVVFFDTVSRNFITIALAGDVNPNLQLVHVIRDIA